MSMVLGVALAAAAPALADGPQTPYFSTDDHSER